MAIEKQSVEYSGGFTLLEMAVVVVIIAVMATFGLDIGRTAVRGSERMATQQRLSVIKAALDAYAERNGYYPCPSNPLALPSNAAFGVEQRTTNLTSAGAACDTTGGIVLTGGVYIGTVPFRSLGLNDSYAGDAWGGAFTYGISSNQIYGVDSVTTSATTGSIRVFTGLRASGISLTVLNNGNLGATASYVVLSHGRNQRGAYLLSSGTIPLACGTSTSAIDVENCDRLNNIFYDSEFNEGSQATTQFDDMVVWGTKMILRNPSVAPPSMCTGACEPWCATCENLRTSAPPSSNTRVCAKFIVDPVTCQAVCIWPNATTACP